MAFMRSTKTSTVGSAAARAREEGHSIFIAQLHPGAHSTGWISGSASDLSEMIESIEAQGWALVTPLGFAVVGKMGNDHTICYATFRPDNQRGAQRPEASQQEPQPGKSAPGWYQDPAQRYPRRYFDGHAWSDRVSAGLGQPEQTDEKWQQ